MRVRKLVLLAVLIVSATSVLAAAPPGIPDGWSDAYVYANGIRIHYYPAVPAPGKPVIVMFHGATDIGLSWTTLTLELQKSDDIYMPDARGHGLSDPFSDADNGNTLVEDVVGFVHAMKFEKPILMGHSMGAATVIRVGAQYPALPRAVIMLDPFLGHWPPGGPGASGPAPSAQSGRAQEGAAPTGAKSAPSLPVSSSVHPKNWSSKITTASTT